MKTIKDLPAHQQKIVDAEIARIVAKQTELRTQFDTLLADLEGGTS